MKALFISGSRNPNGQTAQAARALLEGITTKGGEGELVFLPRLTIERCRQCDDDGWGKCRREGVCVIEDDFAKYVEKIRQADVVIFATPVYFGDLSESIRAFLDRLRRTLIHQPTREQFANKKCLGLCVAGGSGGGTPYCCFSLEWILKRCGFAIADMIPVRRQTLEVMTESLKHKGKMLAEGTL